MRILFWCFNFIKLFTIVLIGFLISHIWVDYDFYKVEYEVTSKEFVEVDIKSKVNHPNKTHEEWYSFGFTYMDGEEEHKFVLGDTIDLVCNSSMSKWFKQPRDLNANEHMFLKEKHKVTNEEWEMINQIKNEGIYEVDYLGDVVGLSFVFILVSWFILSLFYITVLDFEYGGCIMCPLYGVTCEGNDHISGFTTGIKKRSWRFFGYKSKDIEQYFDKYSDYIRWDNTKYLKTSLFRKWIKEKGE